MWCFVPALFLGPTLRVINEECVLNVVSISECYIYIHMSIAIKVYASLQIVKIKCNTFFCKTKSNQIK
jgi:hypothetical protein